MQTCNTADTTASWMFFNQPPSQHQAQQPFQILGSEKYTAQVQEAKAGGQQLDSWEAPTLEAPQLTATAWTPAIKRC